VHAMPIPVLTDLLIPIWQAAGYDVDAQTRPWLEQLAILLQPSLTRLKDAVAQAQVFFVANFHYGEEAQTQLQQASASDVLAGMTAHLQDDAELSSDRAKDLIAQMVKQLGVKKGVVMRSLRAALTGEVHGPDLIETWLLLNQRGWAQSRLVQGRSLAP
jgi:glutamyl-tRNA synthetase